MSDDFPEIVKRVLAARAGHSTRLAVNPVNSILNYLYALLEVECRLAIAALGLDPEMGVLHTDTTNRDCFACDLMEPIRPDVDAYVLNWIARQPLKRSWFFEERNGNCRLMADLVCQLAETSSTWARLVAPLAEWAVREIASTTKTQRGTPATRLTQNHKRALTGGTFLPKAEKSVRLPNMCTACGNGSTEELINAPTVSWRIRRNSLRMLHIRAASPPTLLRLRRSDRRRGKPLPRLFENGQHLTSRPG